ncbi:MAG: YqeG family HAD IIIA-type phosphatase [bacterium]|nr:YqeG family HAD IIIA-type phosphatase [bacterium]
MLRPNQIHKAIYDIDLLSLKQVGFRAIMIDLDNTLVAWDDGVIDRRVSQWLNLAGELGFKLCLLSNARQTRFEYFARILGIKGVGNAQKPRKSGFLSALNLLKSAPCETIMIGDQLFTDILGAKRLGLFAVLVSPISEVEFFGTRITRKIEKITLRLLGIKR